MDDNEEKGFSSKDVEDDAKELTSLMKRVITFPFIDDVKKTEDAELAVNLSSELVHFFNFTCKDVVQGLLHLYFNCQRGCGHIAFNTFVTGNGEGRILPSMDDNEEKGYSSKDVEDDAKELTSLMKRVITFPFIDDVKKTEDAELAVNLSSELVHFFNFTCKGVPPYFWLDHPYFWHVPHRVNFVYKLSRISKRDGWEIFFPSAFLKVTGGSYEKWWKRLSGPYYELWEKAEKGNNEEKGQELMKQAPSGFYKLKPYKEAYDVVRFVGAVYKHINDMEYRTSKDEECHGRKFRDSFADIDIEADLDHFFPDYYTVMFETVCCSVDSTSEGFYRKGPDYLDAAINTYMFAYNHPGSSEEWKKAHKATLQQWTSESNAAREKLAEEIMAQEPGERAEKKNQRQKKRLSKKEQAAIKGDKGSQEMDAKSLDKREDTEVEEVFQGSKNEEDLFGKKFENVYSFTHFDGIIDSCERVEMLGMGKEIGMSLVKPTGKQLLLFESLRQLCASHRNLLTIFHVARDDSAHIEGPHLLTERVSTIEEYFKRKLSCLESTVHTPITIEIWWQFIEHEFQCMFRDVVQGLLHLYFNCQRGCGHIAFNTFVTGNGEGRILPSMDDNEEKGYSSKDVEDDAKELTSLMKRVITFPFIDDVKKTEDAELAVNLSSELVHFFNFTCKGVPPYFWLDHPYFWPVSHRVNFAYKLSRISKRDVWNFFFATQLEDVTCGSYEKWWKRLSGPYYELWEKAEKGNNEEKEQELMKQVPSGFYKLKPYKEEYDVIRFVGAVYKHINDLEYRTSKDEECHGRKFRDSLADTDIEADLARFFPDYYTVMFETVCCCVDSRSINVGCLKEISSFPFSSNVFRRTSREPHILGLGECKTQIEKHENQQSFRSAFFVELKTDLCPSSTQILTPIDGLHVDTEPDQQSESNSNKGHFL
ncbi:unnamed protein product [Cuscuta campestris]|uniref:Uncharacterized protein n=1 Tax=Cuscuta campestris TaxID=132261 RepID=A0A484L519_9ASTE|nr:unnamed protein product [Cuscuta campestris]